MDTKKRDDHIIHGWIRENTMKLNINIPDEIIKICYIWYHSTHQILKFSDKLQTKDGWKLSNDKTCAIRQEKKRYHAYIAPKCIAVFKGMHCWRVYTFNPNNSWIGWFIGKANKLFTARGEPAWFVTLILGSNKLRTSPLLPQ